MRFYHTPQPLIGKLRTKQKFLWFPKTIENQTVWLQSARWMERYVQFISGRAWRATQWLDTDYQRGNGTFEHT